MIYWSDGRIKNLFPGVWTSDREKNKKPKRRSKQFIIDCVAAKSRRR